jgi:hypothetical protein
MLRESNDAELQACRPEVYPQITRNVGDARLRWRRRCPIVKMNDGFAFHGPDQPP